MEYAVYVAVPTGEDSGLIARGLLLVAPPELDFSLREKGDPSEATDVELCFRIRGVTDPEEALSQALRLYALGRKTVGLKADEKAAATLS
jgi:hypothetical protein